MKNIELIFSMIGCAVALVGSVSAIIVKYAKNEKAKRVAEETVEICNVILSEMEQAEKHINYTGEEKKSFVMTAVNRYAIDNKINFNADYAEEKIEEYLKFSKQVNVGNSNFKKIIFPIKEDKNEIN